jgi:hypothetical protein
VLPLKQAFATAAGRKSGILSGKQRSAVKPAKRLKNNNGMRIKE